MPLNERDAAYLWDMVDAAKTVQSFTSGVKYHQYEKDRKLQLRTMPMRVQKAVVRLIPFCDAHHAGPILFGSRARGKSGVSPDWDFGVYLSKLFDQRAFSVLKQKLMDDVFPNRIDIVNLNMAPSWFLESIVNDYIQMHGKYLFTQFAERKTAEKKNREIAHLEKK